MNSNSIASAVAAGVLIVLASAPVQAGNRDRQGQSGATELLVNPWARSTGVFGLDVAKTRGAEAMRVNIAGLAYAVRTEVAVGYQQILSGSGVSVGNLSLAQRLGDAGVLGVNVMTMNFGEITVRDYNNPSGGIGTYSPQFFNASVGFAKDFSNSVNAGMSVTFVNEGVQNIRAGGACFDAGVQYTTGPRDNFRFGIVLRNVGTNATFRGQGFAINSPAPDDGLYEITRETPSERFQMPTYLNFGVAYDFYLGERRRQGYDDTLRHRLTPMVAFTSNSFISDYLGGGIEYAYDERFMLRAGYRHEFSGDEDGSYFTGLSAGATVMTPIGKGGPTVAFDYSYRPTKQPVNGIHAFTLRFALGGGNGGASSRAVEAAAPVTAPAIAAPPPAMSN